MLSDELETSSCHNIVNLQKALDKYVYELEENYNKYLRVQSLKEEVQAEVRVRTLYLIRYFNILVDF